MPLPTGGPSSNGFRAPSATRPTKLENRIDSLARWRAGGAHNEMLQDVRQVRLPLHGDVEPDDRRTGRGEQGRDRWRAIGGTPAGVSPTGFILRGQVRPGEREQYPVGLGIANLDSLDVDRERHRARQHELIRDVEAPVGAPHGARAREHRRREPGELRVGLRDAGSRDRYPGRHDQRRNENREPHPAMP